MQTIEQQLEELEQKIRRIEVLPDEFGTWQANKVTQRFLLETQYAMMLAVNMEETSGAGDDVDRVALQATYKKAMKDSFEMTLTWNPEDFID